MPVYRRTTAQKLWHLWCLCTAVYSTRCNAMALLTRYKGGSSWYFGGATAAGFGPGFEKMASHATSRAELFTRPEPSTLHTLPLHTWAENFESSERINLISETNRTFDLYNWWLGGWSGVCMNYMSPNFCPRSGRACPTASGDSCATFSRFAPSRFATRRARCQLGRHNGRAGRGGTGGGGGVTGQGCRAFLSDRPGPPSAAGWSQHGAALCPSATPPNRPRHRRAPAATPAHPPPTDYCVTARCAQCGGRSRPRCQVACSQATWRSPRSPLSSRLCRDVTPAARFLYPL